MALTASDLHNVVSGIERAINRFPEICSADATIAFSGGKDSIALACGLAAMGRRVNLRAIDMGYSLEWRGRIESLAHSLSLPLEVIEVSKLTEDDALDADVRHDLAVRRAFLDGTAANSVAVTPCTNCYNCKIISLVHGTKAASREILFAHHAEDALSSFLKSALMYIDRWEERRIVFDKDAFRSLGMRIANDLREGNQNVIDKVARLLADSKAHTSEPPIERRVLHGQDYVISRPLFFVKEADTSALAYASGVRPESSGCGHSSSAVTRTPREIVHHELLPIVAETKRGRAALGAILDLLSESLLADGTATADVRGMRHILLGIDYKGGPAELADRL
jgi:hypothetical protein